MAKPRKGPRGRGKVLYVGGAEVRLIKAGKAPSGASKKTVGSRSVLVPSGGRGVEAFPAVNRLVRSLREASLDDPDEGR